MILLMMMLWVLLVVVFVGRCSVSSVVMVIGIL